jgi:hypothetical protein
VPLSINTMTYQVCFLRDKICYAENKRLASAA